MPRTGERNADRDRGTESVGATSGWRRRKTVRSHASAEVGVSGVGARDECHRATSGGRPVRRAVVRSGHGPRHRGATPTGSSGRGPHGARSVPRTCPGQRDCTVTATGRATGDRADNAASPAEPSGTTGDVRSSERLTPAGRPSVDGSSHLELPWAAQRLRPQRSRGGSLFGWPRIARIRIGRRSDQRPVGASGRSATTTIAEVTRRASIGYDPELIDRLRRARRRGESATCVARSGDPGRRGTRPRRDGSHLETALLPLLDRVRSSDGSEDPPRSHRTARRSVDGVRLSRADPAVPTARASSTSTLATPSVVAAARSPVWRRCRLIAHPHFTRRRRCLTDEPRDRSAGGVDRSWSPSFVDDHRRRRSGQRSTSRSTPSDGLETVVAYASTPSSRSPVSPRLVEVRSS